MKYYKYDYDRTCFLIKKNNSGTIKHYLKVNFDYIEVSENVFKLCRSSYDKIRKEEKNKVGRSILNFQDMDRSTFFVANEEFNHDIVHEIYLKDIAKRIKKEILILPERDRKIATCIFIEEYTDRETSRLLHIPQTTVSYRKKIIREKIKNNIKFFCSIDE